jgi:hypothetical protein
MRTRLRLQLRRGKLMSEVLEVGSRNAEGRNRNGEFGKGDKGRREATSINIQSSVFNNIKWEIDHD